MLLRRDLQRFDRYYKIEGYDHIEYLFSNLSEEAALKVLKIIILILLSLSLASIYPKQAAVIEQKGNNSQIYERITLNVLEKSTQIKIMHILQINYYLIIIIGM
jgi:hypothetical protein